MFSYIIIKHKRYIMIVDTYELDVNYEPTKILLLLWLLVFIMYTLSVNIFGTLMFTDTITVR